MLTPIFRLEQTDAVLRVIVHAPMAKLSELEICVEDDIFYFTAPPYYLQFHLPGPVCTEEETFKIEFNDGDIAIGLQKIDHTLYKDLGLITKLLNHTSLPSKPPSNPPLIKETQTEASKQSAKFTSLNWFLLDQYDSASDSLDENYSPEILLTLPCYGFSGRKSGLFQVDSDLSYVIDLPDPDRVSPDRRSILRVAEEKKKFSPEHYLADFFEPEVWATAKTIHPPWRGAPLDAEPELTNDERHRLIALAARKLPPAPDEESEEVSLYLGLVDLLLAYVYDYRVREAEEMTESGWNIAKLASTLSWFEVFHNLPQLLTTFYRRSLVYPLVRSWKFCVLIRLDVAALLQMKHVKSWCLKCLLDIRRLLIAYPGYHVFADLYLDDYVVWIQTRAQEDHLRSLGQALKAYKVQKDMVGLDLLSLEEMGKNRLEEERLAGAVGALSLKENA
ncbi:Hsp90 cochaperone shq1 [Clonorchis sinensis]|uniref:Protein SHQ1 homolog n=1 Tax=Clonorchis sinensis TaxID=79923 RepID=A0A419QCH2_CLOSI|nr:Hsp90 cochaperone shq1 [Clonorchis sinensis]